MTGALYYRLWRPPTRAVCGLRYPSRGYAILVRTNPGPVQSEILRFALTKSLQPGPRSDSVSDSERHLREIFLEGWPVNSSPTPLWSLRVQSTASYWDEVKPSLDHAQSLQDLQQVIERSVTDKKGGSLLGDGGAMRAALERCEQHNTYGEILSFINGLEMRRERLSISSSNHRLSHLGVYYACLALSESALEHHLRGYRTITDIILGINEGGPRLVNALLSSLKTLSFQKSRRDIRRLRDLVTGEANPETPNLHSILSWSKGPVEAKNMGEYLSLLVKIQSDTVLPELWDKYLESTVDDSSLMHFESAYVYAMALVDAGNPDKALLALTQVSKQAGNTLPGFALFRDLDKLLKDDIIGEALPELVGEKEYGRILISQLTHIEQRLGITWDCAKGLHADISDPCRVASEQPIFTMDGDSLGYESPQRLVAEIRALGCSKSTAELSKIADLLDDHEGNLIPISAPLLLNSDTEFYWAPQRAPVELRDKSPSIEINDTHNVSHSNLGLVKVVTTKEESPSAFAPSLYLMQLGYLLKKRQSPSDEGLDLSAELEETGHLVTWDRAFGRFLTLYVGTGRGSSEPTTTGLQTLNAFGDLDAITQVFPLEKRQRCLKIQIPAYRLELDTNPDLVFDLHT